MIPLTEEGDFRVDIHSYKLQAAQSTESKGAHFGCLVTHRLDYRSGQWEPMNGGPWGVDGTIWFIGKDGLMVPNRVEMIMEATGWDGETTTLMAVDPETFLPLPDEQCWKPNSCQAYVKADEYKGKKQFKIDRLYPVGGGSRVKISASQAQMLAWSVENARRRSAGQALIPMPGTPDNPASHGEAVPF